MSKYGKNAGYEGHHLIEKRFAHLFGQNPDDMISVVLSTKEHRDFTNAWLNAIGYNNEITKALRTGTATKDDIIYSNTSV